MKGNSHDYMDFILTNRFHLLANDLLDRLLAWDNPVTAELTPTGQQLQLPLIDVDDGVVVDDRKE